MEHGSLSRVAIGECLVPHVKSSFFRITDVEVTQDNAHRVGIRRPMRVDKMQSVTSLSQGKFRFKKDVDDH